MSHFLFVTWDGGGNVPPALATATALRERGHTVRVLGHASQRAATARDGLELTAYRQARSRAFDGTRASSLPQLVSLFTDGGMGPDLLDEVQRRPPDLVVVDCLLAGVLAAARRHGLRYATFEHLFDGYLRGGWLHGPIGLAARAKGLRPVTGWDAAAVAVVATLPSLDPGHAPASSGNRRWSGPVVEDAPAAAKDWSRQQAAVLVSLSTFGFPGMTEVLQRVLDAVAGLDARVVVTTGPVVEPGELRAPAGVEVHRYVDHATLMPSASLVVGHGGHATTMRALAHDLPLLVLPMHPMVDQPVVGRRVQAAGAGRLLPRRSPARELRAAIEVLLADGPHRAAAARLGAEIRHCSGRAAAADALEAAITAPAVDSGRPDPSW